VERLSVGGVTVAEFDAFDIGDVLTVMNVEKVAGHGGAITGIRPNSH
jgi:hypothetical protein